ncbi:MAG TPA: BMP family ABC transporter substrate-binding protein [Fimbriimonas sp.]
MKIGTLAALALGVLLIGGCDSGGDSAKSGDAKAAADGESLRVGVVFDSGGRGDKSFNDSAWAGIEKAQQELGLQDPKSIESRSEKDYNGNLTSMAEQDLDLVVAVGLAQSEALKSVAPKFPDVKFAIVDSVVEAPNVRSLVFAEEQGSFLAGYLAALVSKTGKIGFVGGKSIPLIKKFEVGYIAGAKKANPAVEVLPAKYTESWDDTILGKRNAESLFKNGADIVYHAAGRCGLGVIDAAKETGNYAIGVDSDQDGVAPGSVLTSMMKRVDEAVFQTIKDVKEGKFSTGTRVYDLKTNGVGLSPMTHTKDKVGQETLDKVDAISNLIAAGEIKVPSNEAELADFLKSL